jgi:hypothetical protein
LLLSLFWDPKTVQIPALDPDLTRLGRLIRSFVAIS